jgi:hypothetical protein
MTAIGKHTFFLGMRMEIDEHSDAVLKLQDIFFDGEDLSAAIGVRCLPAAVEVVTCDVAAGVAQDDAVRVEHWDDFDNVVFKQFINAVMFVFLERCL